MATTTANTTRAGLLGGRSPLLRLQSDERLIALMRGGNDAAFEVLFGRYRSRLLGFCRHMLGSKEDAEDVLQEVFANAYRAVLADSREINVRPWLYRIARNRCLNHLRRPTTDASDTMDEHVSAHGRTAADVVHKRDDVRHLLEDVQRLPESQRTALLLREIDALSYDQIAEAMDTSIPSVKSLLVRARVSLAEAAEARQLSCDDVRRELAEISEGLRKASPAHRRHLRECEECKLFRTQLRKTTVAMAVAFPIGPLLILKKVALLKLGGAALAGGGGGGGAAAAGTAATGASVTAATGASVTAATGAAGTAAAGGLASAGSVGLGAVATKAVAGMAVTAIIAGGAVEAKRVAAPSKPAVSAPAQVQHAAPPAANPTGGASLHGAPATLTEPAKEAAAAESKPVETSTAEPAAPAQGASGATGPAEATGDDKAAPVDPDAAPVTGSEAGTAPQTGGAAVPVAPAGKQQGTTGATGSSAAAGTTGTSVAAP
jgi:RNA polymerase sigma factor (sigma-70 family)